MPIDFFLLFVCALSVVLSGSSSTSESESEIFALNTLTGCFQGLEILRRNESCANSSSQIFSCTKNIYSSSKNNKNITQVFDCFQNISSEISSCNNKPYNSISANLKKVFNISCNNYSSTSTTLACEELLQAEESLISGLYVDVGYHVCLVFIKEFLALPANSSNSAENQEIYFTVLPVCILSLCSCTYIFYLFCRYEELRDYEMKLFCVLSVLDGILCLVSLLPGVIFNDTSLCLVQGLLIQVFTLAGVMWTGIIALLLWSACRNSVIYQINFGWGITGVVLFSTLTSVLPFTWNLNAINLVYVPAGAWCWFPAKSLEEKFGLLYVPLSLIVVMVSTAYCYIRTHTRRNLVDANSFFPKLRYYPLILCFCLIPLAINRLLEGFITPPIELKLWAALSHRLLGFFNALVYGYTNEVRRIVDNTPNNQLDSSVRSESAMNT